MIQAGTISSGSSRTCGVVGAYWISSISSLRNTTLPSVTAMFSAILKSSRPFNFSPRASRARSSARSEAPATKLAPAVRQAASRTVGLVQAKLTGASAFSMKLPRKSTRLAWWRVMPGTLLAAACHCASAPSWAWARRLNGGRFQPGSRKRRSSDFGPTSPSWASPAINAR